MKSKKKVVFYLILSTILFATHFMCLGGWTGASMGIVELVFLITMYVLELKDKTKYSTIVSIITIIVSVVLSIITWDTWVSVLSMSAMVIYLVTMMFTNIIIVKGGVFVRITLNAIYMFLLQSYFGAILSIAILVATIVGIVKDYRAKNSGNISQESK